MPPPPPPPPPPPLPFPGPSAPLASPHTYFLVFRKMFCPFWSSGKCFALSVRNRSPWGVPSSARIVHPSSRSFPICKFRTSIRLERKIFQSLQTCFLSYIPSSATLGTRRRRIGVICRLTQSSPSGVAQHIPGNLKSKTMEDGRERRAAIDLWAGMPRKTGMCNWQPACTCMRDDPSGGRSGCGLEPEKEISPV